MKHVERRNHVVPIHHSRAHVSHLEPYAVGHPRLFCSSSCRPDRRLVQIDADESAGREGFRQFEDPAAAAAPDVAYGRPGLKPGQHLRYQG